MIRRIAVVIACHLCATAAGLAQDAPLSWGHATPVRPADAATIRSLIAGQIEAFGRGDRPGAYAATAPNVRRKFPTADAFAAMARSAYAPLLTVGAERFDLPRGGAATETQGETWSQTVDIATRAGERWTAVYGLERQPDGSIAITSCVLVRRTDSSS